MARAKTSALSRIELAINKSKIFQILRGHNMMLSKILNNKGTPILLLGSIGNKSIAVARKIF